MDGERERQQIDSLADGYLLTCHPDPCTRRGGHGGQTEAGAGPAGRAGRGLDLPSRGLMEHLAAPASSVAGLFFSDIS